MEIGLMILPYRKALQIEHAIDYGALFRRERLADLGSGAGVDKVDKLTIIAHDRFQAIVDAANDPNSIIRKEKHH